MFSSLPLDLGQIKGGVESATINLLEGFSFYEDNCTIQVVTFGATCNTVCFSSKILITYLKKKCKVALIDYFLSFFVLKKIISDFQPDVIHIQGSGPSLLRFVFFRKHNIIVTQHGVSRDELKTKKTLPEIFKFSFKAIVEKYIFPLFKNYIFISEYNKKRYPGCIENINYSLIPNALSPLFFEKKQQILNNHSLIYVGGIYEGKNLMLLMECVSELSIEKIEYSLNIIGGAKNKKYYASVLKYVENNRLNKRIHFLGWLNKLDVIKAIDKSFIFVLPSNQEALPMSIAEAMARGRIVIGSRVGGIPSMIENGVSGYLFEKNNKEELKSILRKLYEELNYNVIVNNAEKYAYAQYHPINVAKETLAFYHKILS